MRLAGNYDFQEDLLLDRGSIETKVGKRLDTHKPFLVIPHCSREIYQIPGNILIETLSNLGFQRATGLVVGPIEWEKK